MADKVSMSLDDIIKSDKKSGKFAYGGGRRGAKSGEVRFGGGGRGRNRANQAHIAGNSGGGAAGSNRRRGGGGQNSFRGRKGQATNNVQGRRGYRGYAARQRFAATGSGLTPQNFPRAGGNRSQNRGSIMVNKRGRNANRQVRRQRNRPAGTRNQQGISNQRYFTAAPNVGVGITAKRYQGGRIRPKRNMSVPAIGLVAANINKNTKRVLAKLAKKRLQRAKLVVSRVKKAPGGVKSRKSVINSGRVALGKNGFVTVRNTKSKRMERALVQMKIARAQQARNKNSPQRTVNLPGSSAMIENPRVVRSKRNPRNTLPRPGGMNWNAPIIRTMTNDLADEMTNSHLNPDIQRKIAFIQSRSKSERAPVMPDFKAPVTTSRMKLSDRFRLLRDQ